MLISLIQTSPITFVIIAVILMFSLAWHELGHAWVANRMGDPTAKNLGRITLNPFNHLDPIGSLLILVVGFGWAKPVPIQPRNFTNLRSGLFWVSIAGVLVNFIVAVVCLAILKYFSGAMSDVTQRGLFLAAYINILLVIFNLLPIPPLDGSKVVQSIAPASWWGPMMQLERYGFMIVIGFIILMNQMPSDPLGQAIDFVISNIMLLLP